MKYKVIRSARKTLSLSVTADNEIIVRCPKRYSDEKIADFVNQKKSWLEKVISKNSVKVNANQSIINYKEVLVGGERLPLIISEHNEITPSAVYVKNIQSIKNTFIKEFKEGFVMYADILSKQLYMQASGFAVRQYKSRWGCCDTKDKITFNWLLFMLPYDVQKYVIIHELCHTVYFNHSKLFWQLVNKYEPRYKELRTKLKSYDFLIKLY